jgi:hypothetical protein
MSGTAMPSVSALRDLNIRSFRFEDETVSSPVIFIHAPRESGTSTLLGSLLVEMQKQWGLDGAFVLTDRADSRYMGGILPKDIILDKPFEYVLRKLIEVQRHRQGTVTDRPALKLALVVDDFIYSSRELKSTALQRDIKLAKSYNISILLATPDVSILPANVLTLATHVLATKCISTEEPKFLKKNMFVRFDSAVSLADTLALCKKHEFLMGLLRLKDGNTLLDFSRSYAPTLYMDRDLATEDAEPAVFAMDPELISHMTYALGIRYDLP